LQNNNIKKLIYLKLIQNFILKVSSCAIANPNHQALSDLLEGDFQYIISDNEMILKNNSETEITLRRVNQLDTTTPVSTSMSINTTVQ
jgi:hypothetical protein